MGGGRTMRKFWPKLASSIFLMGVLVPSNGPSAASRASDVILEELAKLKSASSQPFVICKNQTYALCATAPAFVYQEVSYAKCQIKRGDSISAPPLSYPPNTINQKNICDFNAEGVNNGYMASTYSLPPSIVKGGNQALYTCSGSSTGSYAQCDGGTCFTSTVGNSFPGLGQLGKGEIVCSCPITKANTSVSPFGFQFVGPYPCQADAFKACTQSGDNGDIIKVGAPPGAGRYLTIQLTGQSPQLNECLPN